MDKNRPIKNQMKLCIYCRIATEEQIYGGFKKAELDAMLSQFLQSQHRLKGVIHNMDTATG